MKHRAHRITLVVGVLVAAFALSFGAMLSPRAHGAVSSTIHAYFDADGHLMFTYSDGSQVSSTIPPGTYTVVYDNLGADDLAVDHAFHLSGPNVNFAPAATVVQTTIPVTFTAGSTYTLQDDLHPTVERRTFVAGAAGGSTDTATVASTPTSTPKSTTKPVSNDVVGADVLPLRGTLSGAVSVAGKLSLLFKGKAVGQLKAGRYTFAVSDKSSKTAFKVQRIKKGAVTVTGVKEIGPHKVTLPLDAGQWWFFSGSGKKTFFIVVN